MLCTAEIAKQLLIHAVKHVRFTFTFC